MGSYWGVKEELMGHYSNPGDNLRDSHKGYSLHSKYCPFNFPLTSLSLPRNSLIISLLLLFLLSCGSGDDDGSRLAEQIVGTWYRGWGEGDVEIIGDVGFKPDDFSYHYFTFNGDGTYNGMVRDGSFYAIDTHEDTIYVGTYKCDNDNLRLEYTSSGQKQKIQARVLSFDEMTIRLEYKNTDQDMPVTVRLKLSSTPTKRPSLWDD